MKDLDYDAHLARQVKLCKLLGLEPNQTRSVTIEWEPGTMVAKWEGYRLLTEDEIKALGELMSE